MGRAPQRRGKTCGRGQIPKGRSSSWERRQRHNQSTAGSPTPGLPFKGGGGTCKVWACGGADMDTVASPQSPFPLGEAHICHCPQAAGAEGQSSACLNWPPTWMGPGSGTLHTPGPTVTLWPGLPRPSPLAPTLGSPNSPVLPKTHPSCLPAGLGLALGQGACGVSCQRPDRVTSALPREVR